MFLVDATNAPQYLRDTDRVDPDERIEVRELAGGVSNVVSYVAREGEDFVLKQSREQLRVADPWFCTPQRIWREAEVMRVCERLLRERSATTRHAAVTPRILFEDRDNYLFAMTAAPPDHQVWKTRLLAGEADPEIAAACGDLLATLHADTYHDSAVADQLDDRAIFDDLRIDPYFRKIAERHTDLRDAIEALIESVWSHRICMAHGDFSPKNLLVYRDGEGEAMMLVDFEVGHYGDGAFDLGFFLSHLVLKAVLFAPEGDRYLGLCDAFWASYRQGLSVKVPPEAMVALECRAVMNFAGCALARLDGKSPVEYLTDEARRRVVRQLCREIFHEQPQSWADVTRRLRDHLARLDLSD